MDMPFRESGVRVIPQICCSASTKSPVVFQKYADNYIHTFTQQSDTGLEMDLLQKYIFIPLDIFKENVENKGIKNKMDGWLTFLGMDEPEKIIELINTYPEFRRCMSMCITYAGMWRMLWGYFRKN